MPTKKSPEEIELSNFKDRKTQQLESDIKSRLELAHNIINTAEDKLKDISNNVISYLRRYYGFTGNDSNYRALVSTGSLEVIDNKSLFKNINNYYMTNYKLLNQGADRDQELFMKFIDYTEKKYKIDSTPSVVINEKKYSGSLKFDDLRVAINKLL